MVKNRDVNAAENLNKVGKARPEPIAEQVL